MFVFSHTFLVLWKSAFPMFWEPDRFLIHMKNLKKPQIWNACVFPNFSLTMGIHFSHILGILWNSAPPKIFEKPITFEYLSFPILFPYYGNSFFPCFGSCMDFCFAKNIWETHIFEMFLFTYFSRTMEIHFSVFWELHGFLLQAKNVRNP